MNQAQSLPKLPLIDTPTAYRLFQSGTATFMDATWFMPGTPCNAEVEYERTHIPGALFLDIDATSDDTTDLPHMLPTVAFFEQVATALGITNEKPLVIYDQQGVFSAPRAWWMLTVFGHEHVYVLNGGLPAWKAAGYPVDGESVVLRPSPYYATYHPAMVRTLASVHANPDAAAVLDARSPARFLGQEPEPRPGVRPGHIPGSTNLHYRALLDEAGTHLRPVEELHALFATAGVTPGKPVITTCGSGITACILALGLACIGHEPVAVYDGSWAEWGSRLDVPVAC